MLLVLALVAGAPAGPGNLDFSSGKFTNWENDGFRLVKRQITSSDRDNKGRTATLQRTVRVPANARQLRCAAALYRPANLKPAGTLDVVVETEDGQPLPRQVFDGASWRRATALLPPDDGALREYAWDVSKLAGQRVRIRVIDEDARPRCHVAATGFEFLTGDDVKLSTMMHETAHQASFNVGLLNREGNVPIWLAEGLATYCEPTAKGQWLGIGAVNPQRTPALEKAAKGERKFIPLASLVRSDDWLRKATRTEDALLGYAQSWALFRMLMEERPKAMKKYLRLIYDRRTSDHRLADFGACFGTDLAALEKRHQEYVRGGVRGITSPPATRRRASP